MTRTTSAIGALVLAFGAATPIALADDDVEVTVEQIGTQTQAPRYDGYDELLDFAARDAMGRGDFNEARRVFAKLLAQHPNDPRTLREAGRCAHAQGDFEFAVAALKRASFLAQGAEDPELHFLRGEALLALNRKDESRYELALARQQLGESPTDRREILWLARIDALEGHTERSDARYRTLLPSNHFGPEYAEIMLLRVEAHTLARDFAGAERVLRELLAEQPDAPRARELLAWVLEARGKINDELVVRAVLSEEWTEHPRKVVEYARALERASSYEAALERYRKARELGVGDVSPDIERLEHILSPEVGVSVGRSSDPTGQTTGYGVAATVPILPRLRIGASGLHETSNDVVTDGDLTQTSGTVWTVFTGRGGGVAALGGTVRSREGDEDYGGSALVQSGPHRWLTAQLRADVNVPWRESASTVREGGTVDQLSTAVYVAPIPGRVLLSVGAQARRLGLAATDAMPEDVHALQLFGVGGVDVTLTSDYSRAMKSQVLDGEMLLPVPFATAVVASYRHYEMTEDDPFGMRLYLVERSQIDEGSLYSRAVFYGLLGVEARGGIGYDWARELYTWRAGGSVLLSPASATRLTVDYDVTTERGTSIAGKRHIGMVVLHVDP